MKPNKYKHEPETPFATTTTEVVPDVSLAPSVADASGAFAVPAVAEATLPTPTVKAPEAAKPQATVSLEAYCRHKGVPQRHWAGMKAFTRVARATYAEWDQLFASY
jgi:hypothetical protein